jgi:two-component system, NtrC family, sensor kinase
MRRRAKPAKGKAEAKRSLSGKSPKNEDARVRELENRLAESLEREKATGHALSEALEQQTATAEVLRIIAQSPTALQPVLDAIASSATHLCGAYDSTLLLLDGQSLRLVAHHGPIPSITTIPVVRGTVGGRSVLERRPVHVVDLQAEVVEFPEASVRARQFGFRTILSVPLLRESQAIGTLQLRRTAVAAFADQQVALLQTFADQAVIAIENVRLFNETKEALEQQTATSEILGVISQSPTNVQPVFDAVVRNAGRLCEAASAALNIAEGDVQRKVAAVMGAMRRSSPGGGARDCH